MCTTPVYGAVNTGAGLAVTCEGAPQPRHGERAPARSSVAAAEQAGGTLAHTMRFVHSVDVGDGGVVAQPVRRPRAF